MFSKLHLAGIVGALTTLGGLLTSPLVTGIVHDPKWSAVIVAAGSLIQAATRAVHKGDVVEVPKRD